ncbi:threonylcarbamoyl-AMP synthase [Desulfonema ishimotonii]|uniref:L-threonylcarbamoyladenylate synthase n=1 Tax=Desulfonema ishimotonii TaxID=45657 RepID=A0A401G190_9BACT|nr:L-threonylcarbamoyladenylate synthase [Desulfonema ishimotonii]GBC62980.1 threonylcarbamoyl-AMP synthase [Desulfonema ishimotonii]
MNALSKTRNIDPFTPQPEMIAEAADHIRSGRVVVFPTMGLYGLGADAENADAVDRIFAIKGRSSQKPILVLIHHRSQLSRLVKTIPPVAEKIMNLFWPGGVTLIFEARDTLPVNLTAGTGKIGVRICEHPVAVALVQALGSPLTGTSANLSGQSGCFQVDTLSPGIAEQADLILDAGPLQHGGIASTVVDVSGDAPRVLREGRVTATAIMTAATKRDRNFVDKFV